MKAVGGIQIGKVMHNVTMTVEIRGMRSFRVRLWIATRLILLAARILQIGGVEFKDPAR